MSYPTACMQESHQNLMSGSDDYMIKVFRSDTGGCAFLTIGVVESDANLIHGVVPTKVTINTNTTNGQGGWWTPY